MAFPLSRPPPKELSRVQLVLSRVGFVLCLVSFVVGLVGVAILMDQKQENSLSRTQFAIFYRRMIAVNPMFAGLFVNGGLIGMLFCYTKIKDHFEALKPADKENDEGQKQKQDQQPEPSAGEQQQESEKVEEKKER